MVARAKSKRKAGAKTKKKATTRKTKFKKRILKTIRPNQKSKYKSGNGKLKTRISKGVLKDKRKPNANALDKHGLTMKERRFVEEYCSDFNAVLAARRAGYSHKSTTATAYRLLKLDNVKAAIRAVQKAYATEAIVTRERVMLELARIAFSDIANYISVSKNGMIHIIPLKDIPPSARSAIHKVERGSNGLVRYHLYDKKGALELIIKMQGWITDKQDVNVSGSMTERVQVYIPDNGRASIGKKGDIRMEDKKATKSKKTVKVKRKGAK